MLRSIKNKNEQDILIKVLIKNTKEPSSEKIMKNLILIDDLLLLQKQRSLFMPKRTKTGKLRKDSNLKLMIEKRIEADLN